MNTPPVLDHLSDLATATGQDVVDSAVVRGAHDVGVRVADGLTDSARTVGAKVDDSATALASAVSAAGKRAGERANLQASRVTGRLNGSSKPRSRTWLVIGLAVLLAAGAGAVVARRRAAGSADGSPVADPR